MTGWESITLRVQTPMFLQGQPGHAGEPGKAEVRPSAIRGLVRFWLRAVVGSVVGDDLDRVAQVESAILGSTTSPSKVQFRVPHQPRTAPLTATTVHDFEKLSQIDISTGYDPVDRPLGGFAGAAYLMGQGLYPLRTDRPRAFIEPDQTLDVLVRSRLSPAESFLFRAALQLALNLDGLGARSHRGFGSVVVERSDVKALTALRPNDVQKCIDIFTKAAPQLVWEVLGATQEPPKPGNSFPTLSNMSVHLSAGPVPPSNGMGLPPSNDWRTALSEVGLRWRLFRANRIESDAVWNPDRYDRERRADGRYDYTPPVKSAEWLEVLGRSWPTRPNEPPSHFPLAVLGLPIVFKKGNPDGTGVKQVDAVIGSRNEKSARRRWPSPLRFRLIPDTTVGSSGPPAQRLLTVGFAVDFLPPVGDEQPQLVYSVGNRPLKVEVGDLQTTLSEWTQYVDASRSELSPRSAPTPPTPPPTSASRAAFFNRIRGAGS
ncbi:type III-B CRISPR module RAMP protein Cmr1 [Microbacterium sp.]|uniref:type III-B CRISPR module RAMP protein Cmr1 n=1 Tax=Microbacterium sp. TaxID=51671 RepID=UPI0039E50C76